MGGYMILVGDLIPRSRIIPRSINMKSDNLPCSFCVSGGVFSQHIHIDTDIHVSLYMSCNTHCIDTLICVTFTFTEASLVNYTDMCLLYI